MDLLINTIDPIPSIYHDMEKYPMGKAPPLPHDNCRFKMYNVYLVD